MTNKIDSYHISLEKLKVSKFTFGRVDADFEGSRDGLMFGLFLQSYKVIHDQDLSLSLSLSL